MDHTLEISKADEGCFASGLPLVQRMEQAREGRKIHEREQKRKARKQAKVYPSGMPNALEHHQPLLLLQIEQPSGKEKAYGQRACGPIRCSHPSLALPLGNHASDIKRTDASVRLAGVENGSIR